MSINVVPWLWRSKTVPIGKEEHSVATLQRQINRILNDFISRSSAFPAVVSEPIAHLSERLGSFVPNVSVAQGDGRLLVTVECPGMDERDVELCLTRDGLIVRGERKAPTFDATPDSWLYVESSFGKFERIVPLHEVAVEVDGIQATASKGVITVVLPLKSSPGQPEERKLAIRPIE
jgi:HSP20 family protein